jgi:threonine/homoserine/homoserine lactone efflux protein
MMCAVLPIWAFLAVTVPLVLTPGASTAVVLRNSIGGGTRAGLETALGANAGSFCYGLLSAFGFAILLQRWPSVWTVLRVAGVAYLAWLGVQSLRRALVTDNAREGTPSPEPEVGVTAPRTTTAYHYIREGFITNASNPAIATFYFVLLPQFIPRGASIVVSALLLTILHVALAGTWHAVWAAAGGTLSRSLARGRPRRILDLAAGVALITLAAKLATRVL